MDIIWSNPKPLPKSGDIIKVTMDDLGTGKVVGYKPFDGEGKQYLAVLVELFAPPEWYTRQNPGNPPAAVFGAEVTY